LGSDDLRRLPDGTVYLFGNQIVGQVNAFGIGSGRLGSDVARLFRGLFAFRNLFRQAVVFWSAPASRLPRSSCMFV